MALSPTPHFDFDSWALLAKEDPDAFEERRRELLEQVIAQAPEHLQARLRGLQWRIDMERRRYKHPLKSCIALHVMMWEAVYGKGGLLEALHRLREPLQPELATEGYTARILPFRR